MKTPPKSAASRADRADGFALPSLSLAGRGGRVLRTSAWVLLHTVVIGGVGGGLWWRHINEAPTITVPSVTLPAPNGYTALTAAVEKIQGDKEIGAAIAKPVPAMGVAVPVVKKTKIYSPEEKAALVAQNADVLREVRAAFALPSQAPLVRDWNTTFPELAKFRSMARLLLLEGQVYEDQKEYGKAANAYVDAMQLGEKTGHGGVLIHKLCAIACEVMGRKYLMDMADKLTAPEARAILARLEAIQAQRSPLSEALTEEKWFTQASLDKEFRKHNLWQTYNGFMGMTYAADGDAPPQSLSDKLRAFALMMRYSKTEIARANAEYMDTVVAQAKLPYDRARSEVTTPPDLLNQILFPVFQQACHRESDTQAQNALLMTKLALQVYQAEKGGLPTALDALVPNQARGETLVRETLKAVPIDPFARNGTDMLHYTRMSPTTYLLYSIGPDGVDNNGTPIPPSKERKDKRYTESQDNGDFVLGVNYY